MLVTSVFNLIRHKKNIVLASFIFLSANTFDLDLSAILSISKVLNIAKMTMSLFDKVKKKNTVGTGENTDYQHFLLFQQCFPNPFFFKVLDSRDDFSL